MRDLGVIDAATVGADGCTLAEPGPRGTLPASIIEARDFCRVQGVASPVPGSRIGFEVWLPAPAKWSGATAHGRQWRLRLQPLLCPACGARVRAADVAVATDTGHSGDQLTFGRDNPVAITDWANRSVHESVVAAKQILKAYYGRPQRFAYFSGSSTGGHQALMAAQRHPEDFDGIIAGAPGNNRTNLNLLFLWEFLQNHRRGDNEHPIVPGREARRRSPPPRSRACDAGDNGAPTA